ncbi:MAG: hypothetical protein KF805_12920 [Phycisphaeraceae bacterium]|nr:hypothetical protein [Phycisphaeraceae bacterium]
MEEPHPSGPQRPTHRAASSNVEPKTVLLAALGLLGVIGGLWLAIELIFK